MILTPIAHFHSPFASKFGVPKQSGLAPDLEGTIVFEPSWRTPDALRGLEAFDYLWLIWAFSANRHAAASPVVRPPVLGGNVRMGVFATRSPFRPNPLGLSSVRLDHVEWSTPRGPVIHVKGADLMDGTPIYDIKPYVAYADSHAGVRSGFVDSHPTHRLSVVMPADVEQALGLERCATLRQVLALDPRPHYHHDADKVYGMPYEAFDVRFSVDGEVLTVVELVRR